ncbi:hypothetical protein ON064_00500 [Planococcus sp. A6]|uniref:hypothetical protein n=1 Tax=Planococcus sp. A6 TaxID=2992760 RepID=UPI00237BC5F6|nr:hypothetical protein [Planococcus sp. A6]MDE0581528.1 hypothetical protein [Planococcus sp. A6]
MGRTTHQPLTEKQRFMLNWIRELKSAGITNGPNNQPLEQLDYYDLRSVVMQQREN